MASIKSVYNLQCLVGGTETGEIKVFPPIFTTSTWDPCPTHLGKVTSIKNSADGRFLFTCGEDGALCIFQITQYEDNHMKDTLPDAKDLQANKLDPEKYNPRLACVDDQLCNIVLVEKTIFQEFQTEQNELESQALTLDNKLYVQSAEDKGQLQEEKRKAEQEMKRDIMHADQKFEALKKSK